MGLAVKKDYTRDYGGSLVIQLLVIYKIVIFVPI